MFRWDLLLCSINERLAGRPGTDLEPLTTEWLGDLLEAGAEEAAEMEELREQAREEWE